MTRINREFIIILNKYKIRINIKNDLDVEIDQIKFKKMNETYFNFINDTTLQS